MLDTPLIANRCTLAGNLGIQVIENLQVLWIPTGDNSTAVSGTLKSLHLGSTSYDISTSVEAGQASVVVITKTAAQPDVLHLDVVDDNGTQRHYATDPGRNLLTMVPNHGSVGLPDHQLEVDALGHRYLSRLVTITDKDFHPRQARLFFASEAGDDKFDDLVKMLSGTSSDPKKEAANGIPPATSRIGTEPVVPAEVPGEAIKDIPANLSKLRQGQGAVSLYSNIWSIAMRTKRGHPDPYKPSIPAEASQINADLADAAFASLTGPLSGLFSQVDSSQNSLNKEMFSTEIHVEFLKTVFDGFGFEPDKLSELDSVLTSVVGSLASLSVSSSSTSTEMNHGMLTHGFTETSIKDVNGKLQIVAYEPFLRITYLHVNENSWTVSIGKSSAEKVSFNMAYTDTTFALNMEQFVAALPKLDAVMKKLVDKNMEDFGNGIINATVPGQQKVQT
ncbi:hypothetical protein LTR10_010116 [Elasticomyces elasticus]|nr:hypothetical protein LTR10_010116 [Elasticomyces elasticus]KAK4970406.1 hypothetical protein LTR42_008575 [Elasticomyces elasticus]